MTSAILMLAEDPGAANFLAPIALELFKKGQKPLVFAQGPGATQLHALACPFEDITGREDNLLAETNARLVVVGTSENPDALGLRLIDVAREKAIPSLAVVDGPASSAFRFRGRGDKPLTHRPDWLLVSDEATRADFIALGFPLDRVLMLGHPLWDHVRAKAARLSQTTKGQWRRQLFPQVNEERPLILFLADLSTGLEPAEWRRAADYTLLGRGGSELRTDIVLEELLDAVAVLKPRPQVVLRLHPKARAQDFARYFPEISGVSNGGSAHEAVMAADLVVGMSTILLVEAVLLGRSTLSLLPREAEKALLSSIALGITPCATRREEIAPLLCQQLANKTNNSRLLNCYPGGAATQVAVHLSQMV